MKPRCLILDDEPIAHRVLLNHLHQLNKLEPAGHAYDTVEAQAFLRQNKVDVLFLDIQMPGETGMEWLKTLSDKPVTIATTAYLDFSLEGYELGVMDYLVKPIRYDRFELAVARALEYLELLRFKQEQGDSHKQPMVLKCGTRHFEIDRSDILYIEAMKDYAMVHTAAKKYLARATMNEMLALLNDVGFIRVHKSFIVARAKVDSWTANRARIGQVEIPIGRSYRPDWPG